MLVFALQLFFFHAESQELLAARCCCICSPLNHFNCRARLNSGFENNIVVAKFSMQMRNSFFFFWLAPERQKVFPCQYIQSKWSDGDFFTTRTKKNISPQHLTSRIIFLIFFMRTFCATFAFNCSARRHFPTKLLTALSSFHRLSLAPNHQFDSISQWSDDHKRILIICEPSCESATSETSNWFIWMFHHSVRLSSCFFLFVASSFVDF